MKNQLILLVIILLAIVSGMAQPPMPNRQPGPPSSVERVKHISDKFEKKLKLNVAQKKKLAAAYEVFFC